MVPLRVSLALIPKGTNFCYSPSAALDDKATLSLSLSLSLSQKRENILLKEKNLLGSEFLTFRVEPNEIDGLLAFYVLFYEYFNHIRKIGLLTCVWFKLLFYHIFYNHDVSK